MKITILTVLFVLILGVGTALACSCNIADVNSDGVVNILDVSLVSSCLFKDPNTVPVCAAADVTGNGVIDVADLMLVVEYFGQTC